jgi:drug/metabolite transporter (DMT)-like permease
VLAGVGVGFVGVAILAHPSSGASVGRILLCILSAIMWAVGPVASRRRPMPSDPFTATAWAFGSVVVGYTAYVWLLANAPLGMTSTYAYVNPVVAIILGVIFRGEA